MKVDTLRKIDRRLGIPLCLVLTGLERIARWIAPARSPLPPAPKNVLVIQLSEMGSLALAYPAIRHLRQLWPQARVRFLVFQRNRSFLELLDLVSPEDIWTLDDSSLLAFARSCRAFFRKARAQQIDTTLDYEIFSRASMILAWLSGARRRVGFSNYRAEGLYRGALLTHPIHYNVYQHISLNFAAMVRAVAAPPGEQPALKERLQLDLSLPKRPVDPARVEAMRHRLREAYPPLSEKTRIVVLSPFSGNLLPIRAWPPHHYVRFIRDLFERTADTVAIVIGLPEADEYCRPIFAQIDSPRLVNFIGRTRDIAEVIDLFSLAHLFVTTDSGPPHFASLTQLPTLVLFGPESPILYAPLGDNVRSLHAGLHCSPCVSAFNHRDTPCERNRCMEELQPQPVLQMALERLNKPQGAPPSHV